MLRWKTFSTVLAVTALGAVALAAHAEPTQDETSPDTLAQVVDDAVEAEMERYGIPGAVAVVVRDGDIAVARGYGHADRENDVTVDWRETRFDIGSVTKLFTATAVMQLVEQHQLELDVDVNHYLADVQVPETFAEPVTLHHLLTHTAGFDERHWVGWFTLDLDAVEPLGENLAHNLPPRIRPPGQRHQYNNHGIGLAGHAVETVSGEPFDVYITEQILEPLGMDRTTFGGPPAADAYDAVGYQPFGPDAQPVEPWYLHLRPAGGLWTTGEDMAAFMLAHLGHADHHDVVLGAEAIERMQTPQFTSHPAVPGIGYGFFQGSSHGRATVGHGGGWIGFGSLLVLAPEQDLGVFLAFNHGSGSLAAGRVVDAVLAATTPEPVERIEPAPATFDPDHYTGTYRWIRYDRHTFMRVVSLLGTPTMRVDQDADGTLTTVMAPGLVDDGHWAPSDDPEVFHEIDGQRTLAFDLAGDNATMLHIAGTQLFPMERIAWYQTPAWHGTLLALFAVTSLVAAVGWPLGWLRARRRRRRDQAQRPALSRRIAGLNGTIGVILLLGMLAQFVVDPGTMLAPGTVTIALLAGALLLVPGTIALSVVAVTSIARRASTPFARVHSAVLAVIFVALVPVLYHWRLLGFHW